MALAGLHAAKLTIPHNGQLYGSMQLRLNAACVHAFDKVSVVGKARLQGKKALKDGSGLSFMS